MRLVVRDVPPSPNQVLGRHWRTKAGVKNKWIMLIRSQILPSWKAWKRKERVKITLCHSRFYDKDNAYAACKPVLDAMKQWNLIWDDRPQYLDLAVEQEKCPHKQRHTIIEMGFSDGG